MIASFNIIPIGKDISISPYVAHMLEIIEASGLNHHTDAMGTLVEGDWEAVLGVIKRCHERMRSESARVITNIQIDDREGAFNQLESKVKSVERILGHPVH